MTTAYLWLSVLVWLVFAAIASFLAEPRKVQAFALLMLVGACLCLLAGCGGGGDDDRAEVGPPDCKARPELCQ